MRSSKKKSFWTFLAFLSVAVLSGGLYSRVIEARPWCAPDNLTADQRFMLIETDVNGGAVLDKLTGLVWMRAPVAIATWAQAVHSCNQTVIGKHYGARLPTVQELSSLLEGTGTCAANYKLDPSTPYCAQFSGGAVNMDPGSQNYFDYSHFFDATTLVFWTSTANPDPSAILGGDVYAVDFTPSEGVFGVPVGLKTKSDTNANTAYLCVRGGSYLHSGN